MATVRSLSRSVRCSPALIEETGRWRGNPRGGDGAPADDHRCDGARPVRNSHGVYSVDEYVVGGGGSGSVVTSDALHTFSAIGGVPIAVSRSSFSAHLQGPRFAEGGTPTPHCARPATRGVGGVPPHVQGRAALHGLQKGRQARLMSSAPRCGYERRSPGFSRSVLELCGSGLRIGRTAVGRFPRAILCAAGRSTAYRGSARR